MILLLNLLLALAGDPATSTAPTLEPDTVLVEIETELGPIRVVLEQEKAPRTVANFLRYVDGGQYRDGSFYRTVTPENQPDDSIRIEVIQGGADTLQSGVEALPPIAMESTLDTGLRHEDGTISMARREPDSATHMFFITIGDQPELDYGGARNPDGMGFAAFGRVVEGMEVVREIQALPADGQLLEAPVLILDIRRIPPS
jgi:peptidyl-prolyl cis-trans isomerase A (cyclophilin A)